MLMYRYNGIVNEGRMAVTLRTESRAEIWETNVSRMMIRSTSGKSSEEMEMEEV